MEKLIKSFLSINNVRRLVLKSIDVLKTIDNLFLDCHYPLRHIVVNPSKDLDYTVGDLIKDTLKADAVLTSQCSGQETPVVVNHPPVCAKCMKCHWPNVSCR